MNHFSWNQGPFQTTGSSCTGSDHTNTSVDRWTDTGLSAFITQPFKVGTTDPTVQVGKLSQVRVTICLAGKRPARFGPIFWSYFYVFLNLVLLLRNNAQRFQKCNQPGCLAMLFCWGNLAGLEEGPFGGLFLLPPPPFPLKNSWCSWSTMRPQSHSLRVAAVDFISKCKEPNY